MSKTYGDDTLLESMTSNGLTKRELFAILIAMGKEASNNSSYYSRSDILVEDAVNVADLLIKELNKEK